ncbi:hypothetical protein [Ammoniphilus resinae]|uniref:DUF4064 domain-containing protein n=1 Tax=Ammoniphilus resinae TaxID=861532 RepID=A0ABS4GP21_9BACL|nr:hypothetical protein [Ammoniphilus resinae]MBP1932027.1 hypothetical protein [Ammoniphilus resinae]
MVNTHAVQTVIEQAIRLIQLVGLPVMGVLLIIGLMILLTSGKNPRRKRVGYTFTIGFTILILLVAFIPAFFFFYYGDGPKAATGNESIEGMVNDTAGIGGILFKAVQYIASPLTFFVFVLGILIVLCAGKNPQRIRLGYGMMLFSPIVLGVAFAIPYLISIL